ncbi:glycosyltransferase family 2 protein [Limobrevibacterium gyesilva]|uniref:Glycosyltransferase family 2 protein n=1 Tax=Limobrevibacterium gyesilva TaxID=2991712 RepID=A0AA41YMG6_9PROT|nr:glycosyltransferase family 2 protein [Limobrevibacterium gyesilva]MCW3476609.1 glycosyltransferase family 2 protein [Limobrevibacterium gyesilva]
MTVWLYALCWNDARMLPLFFRHYDEWVDRYVLFDDGSTDATLDIVAAHPKVETRRFVRSVEGSFVASATLLQNAFWQESRGRADWVVVTAIDEHLHHPDAPDGMRGYLARCQAAGVTALPALGFQMIADAFPQPGVHLASTHRMGAPHADMNKLSLFDPNRIEATNYVVGRHAAMPAGQVVYPATDEVVNLHYKYMGLAYLAARHRELAGGLGVHDRARRWGHQYDWSAGELDASWRDFAARAIDYRDGGIDRAATHPARWWRRA